MFDNIDTPAILVDIETVKSNISKFQNHCDGQGLKLRPHIKTHKIPKFAKWQIEAGAVGITCQKVSEAEAIISEGEIKDILITYNIIGDKKLGRLHNLSKKVKLSVVADSFQCLEGLSQRFQHGTEDLNVLIECDTGAERCGVGSPDDTLPLVDRIKQLPGLSFGGLMTYPPVGNASRVNSFLSIAKGKIEENGNLVRTISVGGSPDMWNSDKIPIANEYRIGAYIYNDRSLIVRKTCTVNDCALTVLATVISTPNPNRAIIDAGSKVLTSDLFGLEGYGEIVGNSSLIISQLSEEHGCITANMPTRLNIGEKIRIIPNHACVVSNMLDHILLVQGGKVIGPEKVVARGHVW